MTGLDTSQMYKVSLRFKKSCRCNTMPVKITTGLDFPGDPMDKNMPANAVNMGLIPGVGRSHLLRGN